MPVYCLPAFALLPAAELAFCSSSPTPLCRARGQLKDKRAGHRPKRKRVRE